MSTYFDMDGLYVGPDDLDEPGCPECHNTLLWEDCEECSRGLIDYGHGGDCPRCGDTCCCLYPEPDTCNTCEGHGGWYMCHEKHADGKRRCYLPSELHEQE